MSKFMKYYIAVLVGILALSAYPICMGIRVIASMANHGTVYAENFPKYVIPYTPIAIALIVSVLLMPLLLFYLRRYRTGIASLSALSVFFLTELLFEQKVIVTETVKTTLESWQMYMCYIPPQMTETRTWTAIDVLIGEYSPLFKLHFYLISVILILAAVNCLYGFGEMLRTGDTARRRALWIQSGCTVLFLGLCILACFTAFFRDGEITVSPLSALLMALFFILLGITAGLFAASYGIGRRKAISVYLPGAVASAVTLAMYIGELFLLDGNLYRLGEGFLFAPIPHIVLSAADVVIVLLSGLLTGSIAGLLQPKNPAV